MPISLCERTRLSGLEKYPNDEEFCSRQRAYLCRKRRKINTGFSPEGRFAAGTGNCATSPSSAKRSQAKVHEHGANNNHRGDGERREHARPETDAAVGKVQVGPDAGKIQYQVVRQKRTYSHRQHETACPHQCDSKGKSKSECEKILRHGFIRLLPALVARRGRIAQLYLPSAQRYNQSGKPT
jgi:hypothetical protein